MIPKQTIDEIFQAARVEEVIGDFVHLKKAGSNFKAKSPFVDEKTPSFMVSPSKQIWKCFSSGKGGNVVQFLMEHEHFNYVEALRWLANKYQIQIKEEREQTEEELAAISIRENLSIINEFAKNNFIENLHQHEQGRAIGLSYFRERGFRDDIIAKFQLGYCLDEHDAFTKKAVGRGYKLEYLVKAGLTKSKDERNFDFFRGRVMFPIHSVAGKVLGFGGRTLKSDKSVAKYFNSPESELYNKSKILYGLYFAKNSMIKHDRCFLVEGYTDVISLHQSGLENVVASSGTALTHDQIKLIKRYTDNITILYDGDAAGIRASFRGIDMILEEGLNVKVVLFPDGDDPDSFAKKHSYSEIESYIESNSKDFVVFKRDILVKDTISSGKNIERDPILKAQIIGEMAQSISLIPDAFTRSTLLNDTAFHLKVDAQLLIDEITKRRRKRLDDKSKEQTSSSQIENLSQEEQTSVSIGQSSVELLDPLFYQEYDVIRILLNYGKINLTATHIEQDEEGNEHEVQVSTSVIKYIVTDLEADEIEFQHPVMKIIYDEFRSSLYEDTLLEASYFTRHPNAEVAKLTADIIAAQYEISPNWSEQQVRVSREHDKLGQAVTSAIYSLKNTIVCLEIRKIQDELDRLDFEAETDNMLTLLDQQRKLEQVKIFLSSKLGRIII